MTLYDAVTWCQARGRTLPTIYEACPDWTSGDAQCGRVIDNSLDKWGWTLTLYPSNSNAAYIVYLRNGRVYKEGRYDNNYALCK